MSVYIKGMEMPKGCAFCKISRRNGKKMICPFIWQREWDIRDPMSADHRLDDCPLVPIPDHGRLIDADAMSEKDNNDFSAAIGTAVGFAAKQLMVMAHAQLQEAIEIQPTIIPADKEGE